MKVDSPRNLFENRLLRRPVLGVVGVMVGASVMTGITALFESASSTPWLAPTETHVAQWLQCQQQGARGEREHCVATLQARAQTQDGGLRLAQHQPLQSSSAAH